MTSFYPKYEDFALGARIWHELRNDGWFVVVWAVSACCVADYDSRMKRPKKKRRRSQDEGSYICPSCGEQVVIPVDRSAGSEQQYVEDCPVCCNPNVIHLEFFTDDEPPRVWADAE